MVLNDVADVPQLVSCSGMEVLAMHTNSCGRRCSGKQSPYSILGTDQVALEPTRILADDRKGSGSGSSDSAMIEVLAGTDPGSDVADAGTVNFSSVGDVAGTTKLLRVITYLPPHPRQQPALITVHTNATVMDILNKAATLFRMSPESVGVHCLSFGTRNSHDQASTLEEIQVQDYVVIRLLARASGGLGITLFSAKCGSRISSPTLADKSRVVGEYGGNFGPISSRPFDIAINSPDQVDVNGQAKKSRLICIQVCPDTVIRDTARQAARESQLSPDHLEACRFCWGCANESLENRLSSIKNPAIYGGVYTCCARKHVDVAIPFNVWKEK